jgi:16S rRNA (adenine1518-N6/adenine1519-N6)-dimethyltransferase
LLAAGLAPRWPQGYQTMPKQGTEKNQTQTFLMKQFGAAGIQPRQKLGQNFLVDLNLVRLLAESSEIGPNDVVLEVGTGIGSLTDILCEQAGQVVTVELDETLHGMASDALRHHKNLRMIKGDILENKNRLNQHVLDVLREELIKHPDGEFHLAANLPYNVATPIMSNLLLTDIPPRSMTVTIQKELADRIIAKPSTKAYGSLAIWMQCQCRSEIVRIMPPTVFWPQPKVHSAIIRVVRDDELRNRIPDLKRFHTFVRSLFFHRRKFLRSVIVSAYKGQATKTQVDEVLTSLGISPEIRAENLNVDQILALGEAMHATVS